MYTCGTKLDFLQQNRIQLDVFQPVKWKHVLGAVKLHHLVDLTGYYTRDVLTWAIGKAEHVNHYSWGIRNLDSTWENLENCQLLLLWEMTYSLILISPFVSVCVASDRTDPRPEPERFGDFLSCSACSAFSHGATWSHFTSFHLQPLTGEH